MCTGAFEQWRPHPACTCVSVISTLISSCRGILSYLHPLKKIFLFKNSLLRFVWSKGFFWFFLGGLF